MEKKLNEITGSNILDAYCRVNDSYMLKSEYKHFSIVFGSWLDMLIEDLKEGRKPNISLSRDNYLGKKTKALLIALEYKGKSFNNLSSLISYLNSLL